MPSNYKVDFSDTSTVKDVFDDGSTAYGDFFPTRRFNSIQMFGSSSSPIFCPALSIAKSIPKRTETWTKFLCLQNRSAPPDGQSGPPMFLSNGVDWGQADSRPLHITYFLLAKRSVMENGPNLEWRSERELFEASLPTSPMSELAGAIKPLLSQSVSLSAPSLVLLSPPPSVIITAAPPSTCGLSSRGLATTAPSVASLFLFSASSSTPFMAGGHSEEVFSAAFDAPQMFRRGDHLTSAS